MCCYLVTLITELSHKVLFNCLHTMCAVWRRFNAGEAASSSCFHSANNLHAFLLGKRLVAN